MFVPNLGRHICARCLLPIKEDSTGLFILESEHGEASFCYECGILEQHNKSGESIKELDKKWRKYFDMDTQEVTPL
jgi:hypothetical protein